MPQQGSQIPPPPYNYGILSDETIKEAIKQLQAKQAKISLEDLKAELLSMSGTEWSPTVIRGRLVQAGISLDPTEESPDLIPPKLQTKVIRTFKLTQHPIPPELAKFLPKEEEFAGYVTRDVDARLALAYHLNKHPLTQGKQGTGKTLAHMRFAQQSGLPFLLFSLYDDFRLTKLYGDKTIINGTVRFQESEFVKVIQSPSVVLFDEINAVSNANTFDFHALLQNRELYIKDADDGKGLYYKLHPACRIGFAMNPKSAKYIGSNVKGSNFLGRCTFLTFPEFTEPELKKAMKMRFPELPDTDLTNFITFYMAIIETIERAEIPIDISIRQLINTIEFYLYGLKLEHALYDGMISMLDSISQPKAKESFWRIAQGIWKELL